MSTGGTASIGTGYVPPFAAGGNSGDSGGSSGSGTTSFASIATSTASRTSSVARPTKTSIVSTDGGIDSTSLLEYFTKPYIDAHSLSVPTWRYAYILWIVIGATLVLWSIVYHLSGASNGSRISSLFRKYSIRRLVIQTKKQKKSKKNKQAAAFETGQAHDASTTSRSRVKWASPTYAQMAVLLTLIGVAVCCTVVGNDYINPRTCVFGGECAYQGFFSTRPPRLLKRADTTNPGGWVGFTDPLLSASNVDIVRNGWTAAARAGLVSYALMPLCVTLALKQWPFNIWATPFLTNYHFDKTAILHRWTGRIIWLITSGHVGAWIYQAMIDKDPFGRPVLRTLLDYWRFIAGIVGYFLLTLLTLVSFKPLRNRHYELFYWSHVIMVFLLLATCIIHHRPLMWWPIIAAGWWGVERLCRFLVVLHVNGFTQGIGFRAPSSRNGASNFSVLGAEKVDGFTEGKGERYSREPHLSDVREPLAFVDKEANLHAYPPTSPPKSAISTPAPSYVAHNYATSDSKSRHLPAPGFASAQLLPGRMVRLTIHTPQPVRWQPGQHVFLNLPTLRLFESHPYTIASVDERAKEIAPIGGASALKGSEMILLIRAQNGFSRVLWDHVVKKRREKEALGAAAAECAKGIDMRAVISWPLGSSSRVHWSAYESLLIICGGTGVTFGISVLEYTCRRLARRELNDRKLKTSRVRFVWILRDFAHLTWVAPTLRRCLEMVNSSQFQIEIFVSRDIAMLGSKGVPKHFSSNDRRSTMKTSVPRPWTARTESSADGSDAEDDTTRTTSFRAAYPPALYGEAVESVTDLVLFDGEDEEDYRTAGEAEIATKVKQAGKIRRANSRKRTKASEHKPTLAEQMEYDQSYTELPFQVHGRESSPSFSRLDSFPRDPPSPAPYYSNDSSSYADLGLDHSYADETHGLYDKSERNASVSTSLHRLIDETPTRTRTTSIPHLSSSEEDGNQLDITLDDEADLEIVAEFAKPGYPKLAEILDAEIQSSRGKTMVACCGPNGLNTLIRHLVSSRIEVKKVLSGDPRAQVSLVCEDFSF